MRNHRRRRRGHGRARTDAVLVAVAGAAIASGGVAAHPIDLDLRGELVADGLDQPIFVTHAPCDFDRLFIVERGGVIKILDLATRQINPTPFLEIDVPTENEMGLLGMAFHPDYAKNGHFYLNFSGFDMSTRVRRYTVSADPDVADPASAATVLTIARETTGHHAGWIGFGPNDGYLYIASGDGVRSWNGQNLDVLLGKILRIDVDADDRGNYGIPPTNPFVDKNPRDEIWAYGLRNPYRCSFDRETGDLWIGDVGNDQFEEFNVQPAASGGGENYGWRCMEGLSCTGEDGCVCFDDALTDPIHVMSHADGYQAAIGGYVYRGMALAALRGAYVFGDFDTAVWTLTYDGRKVRDLTDWTSDIAPDVNRLSSFGEDAAGELYVCAFVRGKVYRIAPRAPADFNGDGLVDFFDLLRVLGAWGPCPDCREDLNDDGEVGFEDLVIVLNQWSD